MTTFASEDNTAVNSDTLRMNFAIQCVLGSSVLLTYARTWFDAYNTYPNAFFRSETWLHIGVTDLYHFGSLVGIWCIAFGAGVIYMRHASSRTVSLPPFVTLMVTGASLLILLLALSYTLGVLLFGGPASLQVHTNFADYKVALVQRYDTDPDHAPGSSLTLLVQHANDGYRSYLLDQRIEPRDGTASVCTTLSTHQIAERIYFRCDGERISPRTPYVDVQQQTVYVGWGVIREEQRLDAVIAADGQKGDCCARTP